MHTDLILGTAGHIDHGKTSLVKALTGVDCDRLPEEKKRGITIELGFAHLELGEYRLGIVDVPGHERFVRNMLAGATGIDLAMLVVAADDSVKPQTREHLEILRLLQLEAGVIALTKCDLPDPQWIDLVEEEIRDLVAGTFLADAAIVRVSAHTGAGLEELKGELRKAASGGETKQRVRASHGPFRMAIDRTFTIAGHGTVVTGSVSSGTARVGDELKIEPGSIEVRIRGLQNHDLSVDEVHAGQRAAINLAGIHHDEIGRGQELATSGHLVPHKLLSVRLNLLPSAPRALKNRSRVRVHVGTAELLASVVLLDRDQLEPGDWGVAQLFLSQPAVATWRQAFVLRSESPVATLGGGQVLDPTALKLRRSATKSIEQLARLSSDDPCDRASAALYFAGLRDWQPTDLARTAGINDVAEVTRQLVQRGELAELRLSATRKLQVSQATLDELFDRLAQSLEKLHAEFPLRSMLDRSRLMARMDYLGSDALVDALLQAMAKAGRVKLSDRGIALAGHGPQLTNNEQKLVGELIETFRLAGFQPPTVEEAQSKVTKNQAVVPQLVALAVAEGHLVKISAEYHLHREIEQNLLALLKTRLEAGEGLTVSQIREMLGTSRKYTVPICEYLDRIGLTRREGDLRVLASDGSNLS